LLEIQTPNRSDQTIGSIKHESSACQHHSRWPSPLVIQNPSTTVVQYPPYDRLSASQTQIGWSKLLVGRWSLQWILLKQSYLQRTDTPRRLRTAARDGWVLLSNSIGKIVRMNGSTATPSNTAIHYRPEIRPVSIKPSSAFIYCTHSVFYALHMLHIGNTHPQRSYLSQTLVSSSTGLQSQLGPIKLYEIA
jgi:hypothetical protein